MLAKMWKKFLLAVCIIACIYNIMSKLVNRASLEANLQRANDGNTVFDFSSKDSKDNDSEIVEGIVTKNEIAQNSVIQNETSESEVVPEENTEDMSNVSEDNETENAVEEEPEEEKKNSAVKFTDLIFNW